MTFDWIKRVRKPGRSREDGPQPSQRAAQPTTIRPEAWVGHDQDRNEQVVRDGFVAKAKRHIRHIPMGSEVVAMYFCLLDNRTPVWVKGIVAAALAYFIMPLDAVPDILPMIGMSDDIGVLSAALAAVSMHMNEQHRARADAWLNQTVNTDSADPTQRVPN